ncbi:MAG: hypothetical protein NTW16_00045 [Bacteroidetes bacterium]|nr:hypothetical protein [Bacteroidota bacterium]
MDKSLLKKHIKDLMQKLSTDPEKLERDLKQRSEDIEYYSHYSGEKILAMDYEEVYSYLSRLWAMIIWGNKRYVTDKIIADNGLENFRKNLNKLVWGKDDVEIRWNNFRKEIKGMGPAMISEILCKAHPYDYMLWNRRAYVGLNYLGIADLPRYDYQFTGIAYKRLCSIAKEIAIDLKNAGLPDPSLLAVDYFIWDELQVEDNLSKMHVKKDLKGDIKNTKVGRKAEEKDIQESECIHNEIRDKLRDIGGYYW